MKILNLAKTYSVKSNATRDMKAAIKAGQYKAEELEVVVVPAGYQIVRSIMEVVTEAKLATPSPVIVTARSPEAIKLEKRRDMEAEGTKESPRFQQAAAPLRVVEPPAEAAGPSIAAMRVLMALYRATVWKGEPKAGVWVRSASVHDSAAPHGLDGRQVPPAVAALKRAGLVECGWDKAATVRFTSVGLSLAAARA